MPAATLDQPSELIVPDCYEHPYLGADIGQRTQLVPAAAVADNLIIIWTTNMVGVGDGRRPGIFIASESPTEFKRQLAQAHAEQTAMFDGLIQRADDLHRVGQTTSIPDEARMAAVWMGREDMEWVKARKQQILHECSACKSSIPVEATICRFCRYNFTEAETPGKRKATA